MLKKPQLYRRSRKMVSAKHLLNRTSRLNLLIASQQQGDSHKMKEMREQSKVKEYYYEQLERLSQSDRETWLAGQITHFEEELRVYFNEEEEKLFIEELHKKLRKVTRRWASWNHRNFGLVCSREQIKELSNWEKHNQPKFSNGHLSDNSNSSENDPLEKFEEYCKTSAHLLHTFRQDIYRPLCDFFSDDDTDNIIKEIPKVLEKCVQRWEALLQFSPVNERLFNKQSEKVINLALKHPTTEIDSVLRLIPDLYEKKVEALDLARKWRVIVKSKDIKRRGTYTLAPKTLEKREKMPRSRAYEINNDVISHNNNNDDNNKPYEEFNDKVNKTQTKYCSASDELSKSKQQCQSVLSQLELYKNECEKLKITLRETMEFKNALQIQVNESQVSAIASSSLREIDMSRDQIWRKELETIKERYGQQKIKFLNARKHINGLNKQLDYSNKRCLQLTQDISKASDKYQTVEEHLETARKNIKTQGNMVEALQHQCYTLKQDLDQSNIKKGDLYGQLTSTSERCKTVEDDLNESRRKCKEYEIESSRQKSREEELERENTKLKQLIAAKTKNEERRFSKEDVLSRENVKLRQYIESQDRRKSNETEYRSNNRSSPRLIKGPKTNLQPNLLSINKPKDCLFPDIRSERSF